MKVSFRIIFASNFSLFFESSFRYPQSKRCRKLFILVRYDHENSCELVYSTEPMSGQLEPISWTMLSWLNGSFIKWIFSVQAKECVLGRDSKSRLSSHQTRWPCTSGALNRCIQPWDCRLQREQTDQGPSLRMHSILKGHTTETVARSAEKSGQKK